jgi:hypothetical protein
VKLKKLNSKVVQAAKKKAKGKKIEDDKLLVLKQLLADKRSGYEEKLAAASDEAKQLSLKTKLKVVNAHIGKIDELLVED